MNIKNFFKYDFIIIGAGLAGSVAARLLTDKGAKCLIIDKKRYVGGLCYDYYIGKINVHAYGSHTFHTDDKNIVDFIKNYGEWVKYYHKNMSLVNGKLYNFPVNYNTLKDLYGITSEKETKKIAKEKKKDIYNKFYNGYCKKAWFNEALPFDVFKRISIRTNKNNNNMIKKYQLLPKHSYAKWFKSLLKGIDILLGIEIGELLHIDKRLIYSGRPDALFNYKYGKLKYRGIYVETKLYQEKNIQNCALICYPDINIPYLRSMEWKYYQNINCDYTIISKEYSNPNGEAYPYENKKNLFLFNKYKKEAEDYGITLIGRIGLYSYSYMDKVIKSTKEIINGIH